MPIACTAHPFTCLALELLGPAGPSCEYTCLPGYEEAKQLQIHVHSNVQEGIVLGEGVFVKVGEEADGETRCQVTPRPPRDRYSWHRKFQATCAIWRETHRGQGRPRCVSSSCEGQTACGLTRTGSYL